MKKILTVLALVALIATTLLATGNSRANPEQTTIAGEVNNLGIIRNVHPVSNNQPVNIEDMISSSQPIDPVGRAAVLFVEDPGQSGFGPAVKPDPQWIMWLDSTLGAGNYDWWGPIVDTGDGPPVDTMLLYDLVIWDCYDVWWTNVAPTPTAMTNIGSYISQGGKFWLIGHDVLYAGGTAAYTLTQTYFGLSSAVEDYGSDIYNVTLTGAAELSGFAWNDSCDFQANGHWPDDLTPAAGAHIIVNDGSYAPGIILDDFTTSFWAIDPGRVNTPVPDWIAALDSMFCLFGVMGGTPDTSYWYSLPNMPRTASGPGVGYCCQETNTYVHVFGGNPAPNTDHNVYDWDAGTWSAGPSVPGDFRYGAIASYGHKIYLFGGWQALTSVWVYDCIGDSFYAGGNLVTGCNDGAACVDYDRGLIYIIGGGNGWTELNCVQVYDPAGDSCFAATTLPTTWMSAAVGYIGNDTLLVAFGRSGTTYTNNYMFGIIDPANPANITWGSTASTGYIGVYRPGFANMANCLWVFGGGSGSYEVQTVMYETNVGWSQLPDKITPGQNIGGCAVTVNDSIYDYDARVIPVAAGGYSPYYDVFEALHTGIIIMLGIQEEPVIENPDVFTYQLLTPNPVSGNVQIQFALPTDSRVSFNVYDISGRTVNTSTFSNMSAGVHTLVWDRTDRSGHQVSAGNYFFRLEAGENTATGKLIVTE
ncbi:MAG: hypothetical protein APR63_11915 [Desulfuromonas sp. SDB]|nr:MAG: hypothetical protein APR63_11915 [Desulfuromonas sp. SDB]